MPDLTPYVAAVPTLGVLVRAGLSLFDVDLERRARRHASLLKELPEGADPQGLDRLLSDELAEIARRGDVRLHRRINWSTVAALVFVALVGTAITLGLALPTPGIWVGFIYVMRAAAVLVALVAFFLLLAGLGDLWSDKRDTEGG